MSSPLIVGDSNDPFKGAPSFPFKHRLIRVLWNLVWGLLASWTPAPMHRWRIFLLRLFGAKVSWSAFVYGSTRVWYPPNLYVEESAALGPGVICYTMAKIRIERYAVVSQRAHLCCGSHDIQTPSFQLIARPITIRANSWVCAEAFVGPGVTVGTGAVLAARAVAFRNLEPWRVYTGNPAVAGKLRPSFCHDLTGETQA